MRYFVEDGFIFKKTPFKENSYILSIFTRKRGIVAVIAKGVRKEKKNRNELFQVLNEIEFEFYKKTGSDWYIFRDGSLINSYLFESNLRKNVLMQAAAEIYLQLIISEQDSEEIYDLLVKYLKYQKKTKYNEIFIFWRFLLRLFYILGIQLYIDKCVSCAAPDEIFTAYIPQRNGFLCHNCAKISRQNELILIGKTADSHLKKIPQIGNFNKNIEITSADVHLINRIFLIHLQENFHKRFHLRTMKMLRSTRS